MVLAFLSLYQAQVSLKVVTFHFFVFVEELNLVFFLLQNAFVHQIILSVVSSMILQLSDVHFIAVKAFDFPSLFLGVLRNKVVQLLVVSIFCN